MAKKKLKEMTPEELFNFYSKRSKKGWKTRKKKAKEKAKQEWKSLSPEEQFKLRSERAKKAAKTRAKREEREADIRYMERKRATPEFQRRSQASKKAWETRRKQAKQVSYEPKEIPKPDMSLRGLERERFKRMYDELPDESWWNEDTQKYDVPNRLVEEVANNAKEDARQKFKDLYGYEPDDDLWNPLTHSYDAPEKEIEVDSYAISRDIFKDIHGYYPKDEWWRPDLNAFVIPEPETDIYEEYDEDYEESEPDLFGNLGYTPTVKSAEEKAQEEREKHYAEEAYENVILRNIMEDLRNAKFGTSVAEFLLNEFEQLTSTPEGLKETLENISHGDANLLDFTLPFIAYLNDGKEEFYAMEYTRSSAMYLYALMHDGDVSDEALVHIDSLVNNDYDVDSGSHKFHSTSKIKL